MCVRKVTLDMLIQAMEEYREPLYRPLFSKLSELEIQYAQDFQDHIKDAVYDDYLFRDWSSTKTALLKLMNWNETIEPAERSEKLQQIMQAIVHAIETEEDNDWLKSKNRNVLTEYLLQMDILLTERQNSEMEEQS